MPALMTPRSDDTNHVRLREARSGSREAFDELLIRCRGRLATLVRLRLGARLRERVEVDDVLQEAGLRAFRSIESVPCEDEEAFFRWLASVAERVIVDLARRHRRRPAEALAQEVPASIVSPSRGLRRDERFERLQEALDTLRPGHREVIVLTRIHGLPLREVAERMNRSYAATAQLLSRALNALRSSFGDTESLSLPDRQLQTRGGSDARVE